MGNLQDEVNKVSMKYVQEIAKLKVGSDDALKALNDLKTFSDAMKALNEGNAKALEAEAKVEEVEVKRAEAKTKEREADIKERELEIKAEEVKVKQAEAETKAREAEIHEADVQVKREANAISLAAAQADQKLRAEENAIQREENRSRSKVNVANMIVDTGVKCLGIGASAGLTLFATYVAETGMWTQKAGSQYNFKISDFVKFIGRVGR